MTSSLPRLCALDTCGISFAPRDGKQRYCTQEHSQRARDIRRRNGHCAKCGKELPAGTDRRFCDKTCRWAYAQDRRGISGRRVTEPVAVLLPTGCTPEPIRLSTLPTAYGEVARKLYCRQYERCLSFAISKNWSGFGCQKCEVDEPVPAEPGENKKGGNWSW